MNSAVFGKTMKIWENIKILNLSQQKEEEAILCQNEISCYQGFHRKKSWNTYE